MNRLVRALVVVSCLVGAAPAVAQVKAPRAFSVAAVDEYVAAQVKEKGLVGLSLAVVKDGRLVLAKGYGKSSLARGTPVEKDTLFAVGSVTKQFACACVLLLAEDGKLSVHDKVAKYYPGLTRAGDVTLYDLMTHASGYPDYYPLDFVDQRLEKPAPVDRVIAEYAGGKLDFAPGTRWSYSNTGYLILGRVIEKVSGRPFAAFLDDRVCKPLGLKHTTLEPAKRDNVAVGYTSFALGDPEPATPEADGWLHAAGGIYASAADLAAWDLALMQGKLLKPESYRLMTTPRVLETGKVKGYGGGLAVQLRAGETVLRHGGAVSGFLASNALLPGSKSAVVALTNGDHVSLGPIPDALVPLLLRPGDGPDVSVPTISGPSAKEAALALLHQLQKGKVARGQLGADYDRFLSDAKVKGAAERLGPLGEPTSVEVEGLSERGGMEVASVRFTFPKVVLKALLYRTPDGKVQEFLINRG